MSTDLTTAINERFQDKYAKPFDESKHPRAADGRFGNKAGEHGGGDEPTDDAGPQDQQPENPRTGGESEASAPASAEPAGSPQQLPTGGFAVAPEQLSKADAAIPTPTPENMGEFFHAVSRHPYVAEIGRRFDQYQADIQDVADRLGVAPDDGKGRDAINWSKYKNLDENGNYTPERSALHKKIVDQTLNPKAKPPEGVKPVAFLLMGPPAAGKTTVGQPIAQRLGVEFTVVNADDVKASLPEYEGWNAGLLHEESSDVAEKMIQKQGIEQGHNMLMDLTGANMRKMSEMADEFAAHGYDIHIAHAKLPDEKAAGRAWQRFRKNAFSNHSDTDEPGRYVPPAYVYKDVNGNPDETYSKLKNHPAVQSWKQVSTDVERGTTPPTLDEGQR